MSRKIISFITLLTFAFVTVLSPFPLPVSSASAQNIGSLSTLVPAGFSFKKDLQLGDTDPDILQLQKVLNADIDTMIATQGAGSPGNETTYFGTMTKAAVIKFQNKYASVILTPTGLTVGNGLVNKLTRTRLNLLIGIMTTYDSMGSPQSRAGSGTAPASAVSVPLPSTVTVPANTVYQPSMTTCQLVELLISIGAISSSKVNQARSATNCPTSLSTPSVDLEINGQDAMVTIASGGSVTLSWRSSNVTQCASDSSYSVSKNLSGSQVVRNITLPGTFEIYCKGVNGSAYDSVDVDILTATSLSSTSSTSTAGSINVNPLASTTVSTSSVWSSAFTPPSSFLSSGFGSFGLGGNLPSITSPTDTPNIIGYGQANYWMDIDANMFSTQLSINQIPVTYIEFLGDASLGSIGTLSTTSATSTASSTASTTPNSFSSIISSLLSGSGSGANTTATNYYNNPVAVQSKTENFVKTMQNSGITTIINLVDWKYPNICDPQYDDAWFNTSLDFIVNKIGKNKVILQVGSDSSGACANKAQRWNNLMTAKWTGMKSWNQGGNPASAPSSKWFLENHPCSITAFGNPGSDVVTKCPSLLSQLSSTGNVADGADTTVLKKYVEDVRSTGDKGFVYYNPTQNIDYSAISTLGGIILAASLASTTPVEPPAATTPFAGAVTSVTDCTPINDIGHKLWLVAIGSCTVNGVTSVTTVGPNGPSSGSGYVVIRDGFQSVPSVGETIMGNAVHDGAAECTNAPSGSGSYIGVISGPMGTGDNCTAPVTNPDGSTRSKSIFDWGIAGAVAGAVAGAGLGPIGVVAGGAIGFGTGKVVGKVMKKFGW
jgi:hypothetical protein